LKQKILDGLKRNKIVPDGPQTERRSPMPNTAVKSIVLVHGGFVGFLLLDRTKFAASFAADVKPDLADFMADSQVPGVSTP
jgi:hypothetical protein